MPLSVPSFLQSALWSYDLAKMNPDNPSDRGVIIASVLNRGTDEQVRWVLQRYSVDQIRQALAHPSRGTWWPESLNYWVRVLDVRLPRFAYEQALQNVNPQA